MADTAGADALIDGYLAALTALLERLRTVEGERLALAGAWMGQAMLRDGLVHLFGTGHSHALAEEGFHRAGGLALVNPMLDAAYMLHSGAEAATRAERTAGGAPALALLYGLRPGDVLCVFSNSGVNPVPVELAEHARALGLRVVAVTSLAHARQGLSRAPSGHLLHQVADLVIDTGLPPGDALVTLPGGEDAMAPGSTVVGAAALHCMLLHAAATLQAAGVAPPVYRSSNLPGADAHNEALIARVRGRVRHL